jgi:hypothetical protein
LFSAERLLDVALFVLRGVPFAAAGHQEGEQHTQPEGGEGDTDGPPAQVGTGVRKRTRVRT